MSTSSRTQPHFLSFCTVQIFKELPLFCSFLFCPAQLTVRGPFSPSKQVQCTADTVQEMTGAGAPKMMTTRHRQFGVGGQQKILVHGDLHRVHLNGGLHRVHLSEGLHRVCLSEHLHRVHLGGGLCTTRTWPLVALLPSMSLLRGRRGHQAGPHHQELLSEAIPTMIRTLPQNMNVLALAIKGRQRAAVLPRAHPANHLGNESPTRPPRSPPRRGRLTLRGLRLRQCLCPTGMGPRSLDSPPEGRNQHALPRRAAAIAPQPHGPRPRPRAARRRSGSRSATPRRWCPTRISAWPYT